VTALALGLERLLRDGAHAAALAARARAHVQTALCAAAPAGTPARVREPEPERPCVVLEAPLLEVSSSAELTIDTARALLARGNVDLWLRPRVPFRAGLEWLGQRAPELRARLRRTPPRADLWLSAGWPPRADRPDAGCFAVRFDYEYGALPVELTPLLTQEADLVVVHSRAVEQLLTSAGRPAGTIELVPHGVDAGVFHEAAAPLGEVASFKCGLPAVLFVGGLVFRKGIDVFLRMLLQASAAGARLCAVVKSVGGDQHYAGFGLGELVRRFQQTPGAPPLLLLERDLSRHELAGLYRACDLLAHPYRGEGFGLPVLEARACGLPVLVTAGGSTDDFCDGAGVVKIPAARRPLELPQAHVAQPWVLEPDADAAGRLLVQALGRLGGLQADARAAAPGVRGAFTWDRAAAAIEQMARRSAAARARPAFV
jgi:glycosyltransferase involved in cell wall biosynthesis